MKLNQNALVPLVARCWRMYDKAKRDDVVKSSLVNSSIPILFFGDSDRYFSLPEEKRVVTVGLNPSKNEFPVNNRFQRFPEAQGLPDLEILKEEHTKKYLSALNNYFKKETPYTGWFGSYELVLNGLGSSYYDDRKYQSTALHTDFCSPLATNKGWGGLKEPLKKTLEYEYGGNELWRDLLSVLQPHLVIAWIHWQHLDKMKTIEEWKPIDPLEKKNLYTVKSSKLSIDDKATALIISCCGKKLNYQKPFGSVKKDDKGKIGFAIAGYAYGKN